MSPRLRMRSLEAGSNELKMPLGAQDFSSLVLFQRCFVLIFKQSVHEHRVLYTCFGFI